MYDAKKTQGEHKPYFDSGTLRKANYQSAKKTHSLSTSKTVTDESGVMLGSIWTTHFANSTLRQERTPNTGVQDKGHSSSVNSDRTATD